MIGQVLWSKTILGDDYKFSGKESSWSQTQTYTLNVKSTQTPNPTTSTSIPPSSTEFIPNNGSTSPSKPDYSTLSFILAIIAVIISVVGVFSLLLYVRRLKRSISSTSDH
jgi:hypothetical protein